MKTMTSAKTQMTTTQNKSTNTVQPLELLDKEDAPIPSQSAEMVIQNTLDADCQSFNPERLTIARQRRGLSMRELAGAVDLTAAAITRFENGTLAPKLGV